MLAYGKKSMNVFVQQPYTFLEACQINYFQMLENILEFNIAKFEEGV